MANDKAQLELQLKAIERKKVLVGLLDMPAMVVIGLGLFAKLGQDPGSLHPLLANDLVVNTGLIIAVPWAAVCGFQALRLALASQKISRKLHA